MPSPRSAAPAKRAPIRLQNRKPAADKELKLPAIEQLMFNKLAGSALDSKAAAKLKLTPAPASRMKSLGLPEFAAFLIPYFDLTGRPSRFYRARFVEGTLKGFDVAAGKKPLRYIQPANSVSEVYLPPLLTSGTWATVAADPTIPLVITEGELKSACATLHGYPTVGLGGVWSFQSNKHGTPLLPIFDEFALEGRVAYIVYDSDAVTNPDVVAAELRLAKRLTERGAVVMIGRIPPLEELTKAGLDDYIVLKGADSFQEHVLDRAFEYAPAAQLHALNEEVLYVKDPGFVWRYALGQRLTPAAFKEHAYSNVHYWEERISKTGSQLIKVQAAPEWLKWEHRAEVDGVTYKPGADRIVAAQGLVGRQLNSWTGWGLTTPRAGDIEPWRRLLDHLLGATTEERRYFEAWAAYPLQNPGVKMHVAAAIWGTVHGSGKTLVGHTLMRIYGRNAAELKDTDLDDERNEWADAKQFVLADDITARGDRKFMRRLMTMITQKEIRLNPKFIPSYSIPDCINYYFTSNDPDALYMDDGDRRFFICETRAGKLTWHDEYVSWMQSEEGASALWAHLLTLDLGDFDPHAPAPETEGKRSMIDMGKSELGSWVRELRDNSVNMLRNAGLHGDLHTIKELHALYDPGGDKRTTLNALARELRRAGFDTATNNIVRMPDDSQVMLFAILNQDVWRANRAQHGSNTKAREHYVAHRPKNFFDAKPVKQAKY